MGYAGQLCDLDISADWSCQPGRIDAYRKFLKKGKKTSILGLEIFSIFVEWEQQWEQSRIRVRFLFWLFSELKRWSFLDTFPPL
jgi:hypothetical protein